MAVAAVEDALKEALGTAVLRSTGHVGSGCISQGRSFDTDHGRVFVKMNFQSEVWRDGDRGLPGICSSNSWNIRTWFCSCVSGTYVTFLFLRHSALLGTQLADLHLHNQRFGERVKKEGNIVGKGEGQSEFQFVDQFGFHTVTCCGYLPQVNDWQSDWVTFFARQRIQPQMDMIEKKSGDKEARELWAQLQLKIPSFFSDIEIIPALLHGDLWGGNISENESGPVIFDPACFYGHSEYDLAIAGMFGGFSNSFYSAYHSKIPRAAGFEKRLKLYQLFHYLNHWNHFGSGYRGSSLNIMRNLVN
ncbi:ketosamine-3-kinase-like [Serinus canaria]|uniref:ketosamine-3-kinase-like n=1 Tax=Serinus canaria TaxID=9135 RepID=UPI0021CCA20D|nr:ketosamine-3-kinase-like [Serinus canaria]